MGERDGKRWRNRVLWIKKERKERVLESSPERIDRILLKTISVG